MKEATLFCAATFLIVLGLTYFAFPQTGEVRFKKDREHMVTYQIERRNVKDPRVLNAMRKVERHLFIPAKMRSFAYTDQPLPIDYKQTISQPYIVALMTELLKPKETDTVLEIGTGSGYQAAVLAEIVKDVYTIEIVEPLGKRAEKLLADLDYKNIHVRIGDGYQGWPGKEPFDKIIVTAAPPKIPKPLIEQLKPGGRMVLPVGRRYQNLIVITKDEEGVHQENVLPVRFVPMTGEAQRK